jgi:hypothetical protein
MLAAMLDTFQVIRITLPGTLMIRKMLAQGRVPANLKLKIGSDYYR